MADVLTLAALRALVSFSDPQISPDGNRVAYVRSTQDFTASKNRRQLVIADVASGRSVVVDAGPDVGAPRWSPDGRVIAYLRHDEKHEEDQIVVASPGGARKTTVTKAPNGVQQYAWSPDGRRFVYVTPDDEPNKAAAKRHDDLFVVGDDSFTTTKPAVPSHLWLVGSDGRANRRLTSGAWSVYEGVAPFVGGASDPSWSPDGRTIAITIAPDAHDAATDRSTVGLVDAATGAVTRPVATDRYVYFPSFSADGRRIVYLAPHGPGPVSVMDVHVVDTAGRPAGAQPASGVDFTQIAQGGDGWVFGIANVNARSMLFAMPAGGRAPLVVPALRGTFRAPNQILDARAFSADLGDLNPSAFSVSRNSGRIAIVASASTRAPEVYVLGRGTGAAPAALTHDNARIDALGTGRVEHVTWSASDGEASDGLLVHPVGEKPGTKYPLLVWHHGGPEAAIVDAFDEGTDEGYPIGQFAAARGWYTFLPNYRGSDDRGTAHEHAIFGDPGEGPARDVLAGIDAIAKTASIDDTRVCIGGHSYGGFMTSWIIGHDTRWRCAVVADGAVDWMQAYALSGTGNLAWTRDSLGGTPADPKVAELYRTGSPLAYAGAVKTPTLIITGLADDVVPWTESWTYYHALKDHGVPVRLVGIPTARHTPRDPVRHEAYERTILDWLGGYLERRTP